MFYTTTANSRQYTKDVTHYGSYRIKSNWGYSDKCGCWKAFDSVSWNSLYGVLHSLHDTIIKTIQALYDNPTARIKINGYLSNSFTLERGLRQGCAWSPLLFALYLEPFAQYIRQNKDIRENTTKGREHKFACYADDILSTVYLNWCSPLNNMVNYQDTKLT